MANLRITTWLTLALVVVWIISAVVRLFHPWPEAAILDSLMAPCIGYWFLSGKKNGTPA